jgi:apolipoprotein N-acyltransferase
MGRDQPVRRQDPRSRQHSKLRHDQLGHDQTAGTRQFLSPLIRIFRRYPLLLVLAVWVVFLLLASLAFTTMMSLDYSKHSSPTSLSPLTSAPIPAPPSPIQTARHSGGLPLMSLIAIALVCAIGCIVLLRCLQPRRPIKRLQLAHSRPAASRQRGQIRSEASRAAGTVEASLVPPEISQPLDWDEPSLADSLDLRQRSPLSRWL